MKHHLSTFFVVILTVQGAPPQSVYDQKQTGEYNIQVHLKDLQIIAVLGDEALGDYDYNYDYSDFTIKPPAGNVTLKPPPEEPNQSSITSSSTKPETQSTTEKIESTTKVEPEKASSTEKSEKIDSVPFSTSSPDRIKVQIIEEPSPNIAIVPSDDMGISSAPPLGEVLHYRRCATGYARDKRGRCRRVRRPGHQHQFDISRLASNLAARIRGSSSEEASLDESRSL